MVAQGLQCGVGLVGAGVGGRCVRHGESFRAGCKVRLRAACARMVSGGSKLGIVGRACFPCGCFIRRSPDAEQSTSDVPDGLGTKIHLVARCALPIYVDSKPLGGKFASEMAGCLSAFVALATCVHDSPRVPQPRTPDASTTRSAPKHSCITPFIEILERTWLATSLKKAEKDCHG